MLPYIKTGKAQPCDHSTHEPVVTEPRPEALEQKNDAVQGDKLSDVPAKGSDFDFVFFGLGHILPRGKVDVSLSAGKYKARHGEQNAKKDAGEVHRGSLLSVGFLRKGYGYISSNRLPSTLYSIQKSQGKSHGENLAIPLRFGKN